ncbi:MerR family transcriptional regulator [Neobacillus niacini]|uniref:MerR family transcriptional regulator n=1 Tax=Neobacillus niacini TaxID=86668 RepID=UPI0007AC18DE|nr:MerR family transcriptional regulator [Neobacillus niacini]MEC1525083.1 MerR family transcriptional regulator [Neobacillus niacini]
MRTFTLKEVSKKINVKPATLKKWEEELEEFLDIPRTKQGARIYSQVEIDLLLEIKELHDKKLNTTMILQTLRGETDIENIISELKDEIYLPKDIADEFDEELSQFEEDVSEGAVEISEPIEEISGPEVPELAIAAQERTPVPNEELAIKNAEEFFVAMDHYKQTFLNEVKEEIRNVLRKEVVEEVKKEIADGAHYTVNTLSESITRSTETTKAEFQHLSGHLEKNAEQTTDRLLYLSKSIVNASHETSEEIYTLSKQLSQSTEELAHYVDITNTEIFNLTEVIEIDRFERGKERDQFRHEITQREAAFQDLLTSFRDVAAAKEKKWWKFWES